VDASGALEVLGDALRGNDSVMSRHERLSMELQSLPVKLLVVVDDMDRLQS
jgi:hypothetical protein